MAERRTRVTKKRPRAELPAVYTEYASLMELVAERGGLEQISEHLRLTRRRGYQGLDLFASVMGAHTAPGRHGLRRWLDAAAPYGSQLAAVAGRDSLPTQSSASRMLASVEPRQANEFSRWLFLEATPWKRLLASPTTCHRDTRGQPWHVFDFDPTAKPYRRRALPEGDDLPPADRLGDRVACPGYMGRKRGQVVTDFGLLQHAGSGMWAGGWVWPGSSVPREVRTGVANQVRDVAERHGLQAARCVLRTDGGVSGVPMIDTCQRAGIAFVSRLSRYEVLDRPGISERLGSGPWVPVADGRTGPRREALELGPVQLKPGERVRRADGSSYEPVTVRIVVSRYPVADAKRGAGVVRGQWCYEMFAAPACAAAWPADDTVTLYYGRSGVENQFARLEQDVDVKRTFSYHLPGQAVCAWIGLFVWNLRIALGASLAGSLDAAPTQSERPPAPVSVIDDRTQRSPCAEACGLADDDAECVESIDDVTQASDRAFGRARRRALNERFPWNEKLRTLGPGWTVKDCSTPLHCPAGYAMSNEVLDFRNKDKTFLRVKAPRSVCIHCPARHACSSSTSPRFRKALNVTLTPELLDQVLDTVTEISPAQLLRQSRAKLEKTRWSPPPPTEPGPFQSAGPALVPAALARKWRQAHTGVIVRVHRIDPPRQTRPAEPWINSRGSAGRQCRRRTWDQRIQERALPTDSTVDVELAGGHEVRAATQGLMAP